jgi:hypothetical protein
VNKSSYHRLLSEYLDGEVGMADKAAFEAELARDPQLKAEYHAQRKAGLLLSSGMPEVSVHPYRFRQRLAAALDNRERGFTPQRAFASAMAIALVVVSLAFGLYIYQEHMIGGQGYVVEAAPRVTPVVSYGATLVVEASAESFYDRLLVEGQIGMTDQRLVATVLEQSGALEGATCIQNGGLHATVFAQRLPARQTLTLSLADAQRLKAVADSLSGNRSALAMASSGGQIITQQDYLLAHPAGQPLPVQLIFAQ